MRNTWVRLALVTACVSLGQQANAQYLPQQVGAARMPEPAPIGTKPKGPPVNNVPLIEGPISPQAAPIGPGPELSLRDDHDSAFQAQVPDNTVEIQFGIGSIGLARNPIGHSFISTLDNVPRSVFATVNLPLVGLVTPPVGPKQTFGVPSDIAFQQIGFPDDGGVAAPGSPRFGDYGSLDTATSWGMKGGIMIIGEVGGLEINGFGVSRATDSFTLVSPAIDFDSTIHLQNVNATITPNPNPPRGFPTGTLVNYQGLGDANAAVQAVVGPSHSQLNLPFRNAPAGFEGNNGLWSQADLVRVSFASSFGGAEANYRWWTNVGSPLEGIFGVRYLVAHEMFQNTTFDDYFGDIVNPDPTMDPNIPVYSQNGFPPRLARDPHVKATYRTEVRNQIIGPQLGFEGHLLPTNWLALSYTAKALLGVNRLQRNVGLVRGDGLVGFQTQDTITKLSHAYELGASADISMLEKMRLKIGYNFFLMEEVGTALGQVDYNLNQTHGHRNTSDSIFYHGPSIELQFLF